MENDKKSENGEVDNLGKTECETKEEGECSEDEEKSKDLKQVNQYSLGKSRFILEETTGMYYDQVTGYYYNLVSLINCIRYQCFILILITQITIEYL